MIYEAYNEHEKVKQLLTQRLLAKYQAEEGIYNAEDDDGADAKMESVISLLETCNSDLYNIVFTLNEREPVESKIKIPQQPGEGVATEEEVESEEEVEKSATENEIQELVDELQEDREELDEVMMNINIIDTKISNLREKIADHELNKIPGKANAVLIKKIKQLEASIQELEEQNAENKFKQMQIENDIEDKEERIAQLTATLPLSGSGPKVGKKVPNYRSVNLYVSFAQYMLNITKNLSKVNQIFKDGLSRHIEYVEPKTMKEYYKVYKELQEMFVSFVKLTHVNGVFNVLLKKVPQNITEKEQLDSKYNTMKTELNQLNDYDNHLRRFYNYRSATMISKRAPLQASSVKPSLNDDE